MLDIFTGFQWIRFLSLIHHKARNMGHPVRIEFIVWWFACLASEIKYLKKNILVFLIKLFLYTKFPPLSLSLCLIFPFSSVPTHLLFLLFLISPLSLSLCLIFPFSSVPTHLLFLLFLISPLFLSLSYISLLFYADSSSLSHFSPPSLSLSLSYIPLLFYADSSSLSPSCCSFPSLSLILFFVQISYKRYKCTNNSKPIK